jgi:hypothetical protein
MGLFLKKLGRLPYGYLLFNLVSIALYLFLSSRTWPPVGGKYPSEDAGNAMVWGTTALPIFTICAFADVVWLGAILHEAIRSRRSTVFLYWLLAIAAWFATYTYDVYRRTS